MINDTEARFEELNLGRLLSANLGWNAILIFATTGSSHLE